MHPKKVPVTVISGFLGAGKTTLVNSLIRQRPDERIGVIVNEFGEVGIDGLLLVTNDQPLIEINNGCICCTVRKDLSSAILELLGTEGIVLDRLIVETSGLADPAPVLQTFLAEPELLERVVLDAVITVVDVLHVDRHLGDEIVREQIAFADIVVLNKLASLGEAQVKAIHARMRQLNPAARFFATDRAEVPADQLLGRRSFSLANVLALEPDLLDGSEHDHEHDTSIQSTCIVSESPLDAQRFDRWMNQLVQRDGAQLLRSKGVLHFHSEPRQFHFHSVHMLLEASPGRPWAAAEPRTSKLVFIGRDLDVDGLRRGLLDCVH
jgi:G3E family GTPase